MLKKPLAFLLIVTLSPLIAGLYGILHDQVTYTISPEYYTKFKFYQFGLMDMGHEAIFPNPRFEVAAVGLLATWWLGPPIGCILGLVGLIHTDGKRMYRATLRAIWVTLFVALIFGFAGLVYGKLFLAKDGVNRWLPDNLIDTQNFIAVGCMHNFSYLGGLVGLIVGIIYSIRLKLKHALPPR